MADPLTRRGSNGAVFRRSAEIESAIDEALTQTTKTLRERLAIRTEGAVGYLSNEVVLHLTRFAQRQGDTLRINLFLPVWMARCQAWLVAEKPEVIDEALGQLAIWLAGESDHLDFFECRWGQALSFLRATARRTVRRRNVIQLVELETDTESNVADQTTLEPAVALRERLGAARAALEQLGDPHKEAVTLVWVMGMKQAEAAKQMNVTDRTIRTYLTAARQLLSDLMEEQ